MRFARTERFKADYARLTQREQQLFRAAVRGFNRACDEFVASGRDNRSWPRSLRVKTVVNAPGVFEMTWSFSGPDGRATWEWTKIEAGGERHPAVRWRRIGGHEVFRTP